MRACFRRASRLSGGPPAVTPLTTSLILRPDRCRFALGLTVSGSCRQIRATLVAARGHGLDMRLQIAAVAASDVPRRLSNCYRQLRRTKTRRPAWAAVLAAELAEFKSLLVDEVVSQVPQLAGRILAIGELEPGLWARPRSGLVGHLPLSDPALLADLTGLNVIDAFPTRDLAQGGRGGPLGPLPDWLLLHHASKTRVLIDLGPATRVTYLPASRDAGGAQRVVSWVAGPGMRLLDRFARQLTAGKQPAGKQRYDQGGHLAVQGRRIDPILEHWLASLPTCSAGGAFSSAGGAFNPSASRERPGEGLGNAEAIFRPRISSFPIAALVKTGVEKSIGNCSVRDLLCTSTYLIAEAVCRAIAGRLPAEPAIDEIIVTGGGQHHGLLMQELSERLAPLPVLREADLGLAEHARDGAIAATLALLHLDQTPACPTAITGADSARPGPPDPRLAAILATDVAIHCHPCAERGFAAQRDLKKGDAGQPEPPRRRDSERPAQPISRADFNCRRPNPGSTGYCHRMK